MSEVRTVKTRDLRVGDVIGTGAGTPNVVVAVSDVFNGHVAVELVEISFSDPDWTGVETKGRAWPANDEWALVMTAAEHEEALARVGRG